LIHPERIACPSPSRSNTAMERPASGG
jgi:hypothetical protein